MEMSALSYAWSHVHAAFGGSEFLMLTFGKESGSECHYDDGCMAE